MSDCSSTVDPEQTGDDVLAFTTSDEELEAAAGIDREAKVPSNYITNSYIAWSDPCC
jgi:hypothetical protein